MLSIRFRFLASSSTLPVPIIVTPCFPAAFLPRKLSMSNRQLRSTAREIAARSPASSTTGVLSREPGAAQTGNHASSIGRARRRAPGLAESTLSSSSTSSGMRTASNSSGSRCSHSAEARPIRGPTRQGLLVFAPVLVCADGRLVAFAFRAQARLVGDALPPPEALRFFGARRPRQDEILVFRRILRGCRSVK